MTVRARITGVFFFFPLCVFTKADFLYVCIRFAVPAVLLFRFVWRGPYVVTVLVLRVVPFLLFIAVGMMLFVFGFKPFILGLYRGGALRVKTATEVGVRAIQDHKVIEWNTCWKCRLSEGTEDM